jgi:hypothetical protein
VVRLLTADGWLTSEASAGAVGVLPLAVGRDDDGQLVTIDIPIDPANLVA